MGKRNIIVLAAVCVALMFSGGIIFAGSTVSDVITMKSPEYAKHSKGLVEFSHKKHATDYGASCGECHHDDKGKPLDLKEGDSVQRCVECHKETGKKPKGEKLKKKEKIMKYHKEALHANCIGCHKKQKKGPKKCSECHPKKKKK